MTVRIFTIAELRLSPHNVRLNEADANDTAWLEDNILSQGLIFPLIVHPMDDGLAGVLDGGRRFRALSRLVADDRLPRDYPIDCVVRESMGEAQIAALSLSANLRRDLQPYEIHAAIAKQARRGLSVDEIADAIGQRPEWVRQQLRLGELATEVFDAYAAGTISMEHARAYAATADVELQRTAFAHFSTRPSWDRSPAQIRAFLKVGDLELERLLRFVGADVYRQAGGTYELDLFGDGPDRGRVADPVILRALAEQKLEQIRASVRLKAGRDRNTLRFAGEPPQWGGTDDYGLELKLDEVRAAGAIGYLLPAGDIVATLTIADDGEANLRWWWASRKAKSAAERAAREAAVRDAAPPPARTAPDLPPAHPHRVYDDAAFGDRDSPGSAQAARAAVRDELGLSDDGQQIFRSLRRELLRALLVTDPVEAAGLGDYPLGRDYIIWAQLRGELTHDYDTRIGARTLAGERAYAADLAGHEAARSHLEACQAHAVWESAVTRIRNEPFIALADLGEAFNAYLVADERTKDLAGAVLAGLALLRSANVPGWRIPAHDVLAAHAGGDDPEALRTFWSPTEQLLGLFPKLKRLEFVQPHVDAGRLRTMSAMKDADLARASADVLAEKCWVHPLLEFAPAPAVSTTVTEAAQ